MKLQHVALVSRSEESAQRFYGDLLGLERTRSFHVSADLSKGLFDSELHFEALTYLKGEMHFEIFLIGEGQWTPPRFHHIGLEVEDLEGFLKRCREKDVQVMEVPKGNKTVTMIKDFDGNLFEIRQKA
ncbi:MAG: VOC family protein [Deltaproteobacteria bacterium]|nr:VOC family protein [Deltaproteobacteria bacterium]